MLENPKGSPLSVFFGTVRFFPRIKLFSSIFSCFATEWMLKNLKGSPLSVFRHCETLAHHSVHFFEKFSIFEYCKREYLTLGSLFAIFEPWIWRRLGPVPACFYNTSSISWNVPKIEHTENIQIVQKDVLETSQLSLMNCRTLMKLDKKQENVFFNNDNGSVVH